MTKNESFWSLPALLALACGSMHDPPAGNGGGALGGSGQQHEPDAGGGNTLGASDAGGRGADAGSDAGDERRAPNGYVVAGNRILDAHQRPVRLRGVALPPLIWDATGSAIGAGDMTLMAQWGANVVRVGLNQGLWLDGTLGCDASCYKANVARVVSSARAAGLDVILDLHWATANRAAQPQFMEMPDADSVRFWSEVAGAYANDGRVLFELYNEPHDVDWATWRDGGTVSGVYDPDTSDTDYARTTPITYQATGIQALYDAVRAAGAHNVVIAGGLDWAFDLSGVPSFGLDGYNLAYAVHLYPFTSKMPPFWQEAFGFLREQVPILVTEFAPGSTADPQCPEDFAGDVISYADAAQLSWIAWAWFASGSADDPLARCNSSLFFQEANSAEPVFARTPFGERIRGELSR